MKNIKAFRGTIKKVARSGRRLGAGMSKRRNQTIPQSYNGKRQLRGIRP